MNYAFRYKSEIREKEKELLGIIYQWGRAGVVVDETSNTFKKKMLELDVVKGELLQSEIGTGDEDGFIHVDKIYNYYQQKSGEAEKMSNESPELVK